MYWIDAILLAALFLICYTMTFHLILWFENRNHLYKRGYKKQKLPDLSLIIPAYNESNGILNTLKRLLKVNYPRNKLEVLVIDDGSEDNTYQIAKDFSKRHKFIKVFRKRHSGKAASINFGILKAKNEFVGVMDADSHLTPNALLNCMKYFNSDDVAAVTTRILVKQKKTLLEKWQDIEFKIIALARKIKESLNLIDVTPGPLSIYRKKALIKVGMFDEKNLLEDMEIAWRLLKYGYKINMAYDAKVYTFYPGKFLAWLKQRTRWHIGWLQIITKYLNSIFKDHPVGTFLLPVALLSVAFQAIVTGIIIYLFLTWLITMIYYIHNSLVLKIMPQIFYFDFQPNIFTFYGILFSILGIYFSLVILRQYKKGPRIFELMSFIFLYSYLPFLMVFVYSLFKILTRRYSWLTK